MANLDVIHNLLKEVRDEQKEQGKELTAQGVSLKTVQTDMSKVKEDLVKNTADIAEHVRRTNLLEDLHKDNQQKIESNEKRLDGLEEPEKAKKWLKKKLGWILTTVGLLISLITKLTGLW